MKTNNQKHIQIIIDSTTDIAEQYRDRVEIVPLTVRFGEEEYLDGVDLSRDEFYSKLETGSILPSTSQAAPPLFEKVYAKIRERGQEGLVIAVASQFSGTCQSACIAAEDYPEIRVIDSGSVAVGAGILAEYAIRCADSGMNLTELAEAVEKKKEEICLLAMLDTLEYLKRGGRISKTVAFAGGILDIKPVVTVKDGEIRILGKARGAKKANNFLVEIIEKYGIDYKQPVLVGYTGTSDQLLQNYVTESRRLWEGHMEKPDSTQLCSVIGTHVGPGAIAVAFFRP